MINYNSFNSYLIWRFEMPQLLEGHLKEGGTYFKTRKVIHTKFGLLLIVFSQITVNNCHHHMQFYIHSRTTNLATLRFWPGFLWARHFDMQPLLAGFPTGVESMGGSSKFDWVGGDGWVNTWRHGGLKTTSLNLGKTFEKYLWRSSFVKVAGYNLQVCNFTKNELLHTYFSRILAKFKLF